MTLRRVVHQLQRLLPARRRGVTILTYHLVGAGTRSPVDLPADRFAAQMEELHRIAAVVPLAEAVRRLREGGDDEGPLVVLTFDDAYENFYRAAWPVLAELGLPATLFVPVGFVEGEAVAPMPLAAGLAPLTWPQLAEMTAGGHLAVGSHGWSHADLRTLDALALERELGASRRRLEDRLGAGVEAFCYPRGLWDRRLERHVGERYSFATVGGGQRTTTRTLRPLRLPRTPLRRDMPATMAPVVTAPVWLEEWLADRVRRLRPQRAASPAEAR
ncbi:MAG TPA: polysaccharide deacetylase family protein [Thermoanaerobaculia bacterium]|nr:polysaccharide deacetylase family protein [Thermoanaerobaculia bacterium]